MEGFGVTLSILVSFASIVVHSFRLPLLAEIQYDNLNPIISIILTFFLFISPYYQSGGWHGG